MGYPIYHCATSLDESMLAVAGGKSDPDDGHIHSNSGCCDDDHHMLTCPVHLLPIPNHSTDRSSDDIP